MLCTCGKLDSWCSWCNITFVTVALTFTFTLKVVTISTTTSIVELFTAGFKRIIIPSCSVIMTFSHKGRKQASFLFCNNYSHFNYSLHPSINTHSHYISYLDIITNMYTQNIYFASMQEFISMLQNSLF